LAALRAAASWLLDSIGLRNLCLKAKLALRIKRTFRLTLDSKTASRYGTCHGYSSMRRVYATDHLPMNYFFEWSQENLAGKFLACDTLLLPQCDVSVNPNH
jgi:hypothetical protein